MLQIMALTHNMLGNFHTIAPLFTNYTLSILIPIWLWLLLRKSFFSIQIFYSYLIYLVMLWSPMLAVSGWTGPNWWTQSAELPPLFYRSLYFRWKQIWWMILSGMKTSDAELSLHICCCCCCQKWISIEAANYWWLICWPEYSCILATKLGLWSDDYQNV